MVHSEVYLNNYVVSIAPFSTPACPGCSQNYNKRRKLLFFVCFRFSIFHPFFSRGSADPICPYVRTPMASVRTVLFKCTTAINDLMAARGDKIIGGATIIPAQLTRFDKSSATAELADRSVVRS